LSRAKQRNGHFFHAASLSFWRYIVVLIFKTGERLFCAAK
jgi:hypothetical protein